MRSGSNTFLWFVVAPDTCVSIHFRFRSPVCLCWFHGDSPTQSGVASETQEEATVSKATSAPALCHTSRLLENRNTSRILPPWKDDLVMPSVRNGEPRQSTEVHDSGLSASWWTSVGLGQSQGYEERQPHAHVGVFGQSTMDLSRLFLPELCVARLLPQLQSRRQLGGTWCWWWWQSCKEAGSSSDFRRFPLGGVRKVAWWRVSQLGGDGSRGCGSSQGRGAGPLEGFGCEHCESREAARRQAGCGYRRGSSAEEAGETGAQGSDAVPQVYQGSSQIGDRSKGKGCHQARGFAEGRDGSDAAAVAETTGDFGCKE